MNTTKEECMLDIAKNYVYVLIEYSGEDCHCLGVFVNEQVAYAVRNDRIRDLFELDEDEVDTEDLFDHIPDHTDLQWLITRESVIVG
jgi:hypothetical protein